MGTGDRRAGTRDQCGQPADENRIGRCRPDRRQVGGYPLVEVDEFVDLRASEPTAPLDQVVQPLPTAPVGQHEGVDVHRAQVRRERLDAGAQRGASALSGILGWTIPPVIDQM